MNNLALPSPWRPRHPQPLRSSASVRRFWFPLLLLVAATVAHHYWYFSMVDIEWFKDAMYSN